MNVKMKRFLILDIIRGIALLGILLINMKSFHSSEFIRAYYGFPEEYKGFEKTISILLQIFIQMKFYPIFSILFGLGVYLFFEKVETTRRIFIKRMIVLFCLGLIHLVFVWYGDILHLYALTGLLLLLFKNSSSRVIFGWSIICLLLYQLLSAVLLILPNQSEKDSVQIFSVKMNENLYIYQYAPFNKWLQYRIQTEVILILSQIPFVLPQILGLILLGFYIGKKKLYNQTLSSQAVLTTIWKWSFFVSFPLLLTNVFLLLDPAYYLGSYLSFLLTSLSGISLSIFYMCSIYFLLTFKAVKKYLVLFSYPGKMALTNYLLQSLSAVAFFRYFHLFEQTDLIQGLLFALVLFILQVVFSYYWLHFFYQGPLEWLWRSLSNQSLLPIYKKRRN